MPIIEQKLTDENASKVFAEVSEKYPLAPGEVKSIATISKEKDGKVYFCIVGIDNTNKITSTKKQWRLVDGVKELLNATKKKK